MTEDNTPLLTEIVASTSGNERIGFSVRILSIPISRWDVIKDWFEHYFASATHEITRTHYENMSTGTLNEKISRDSNCANMRSGNYLWGSIEMEGRDNYGNLSFAADLTGEKSSELLQIILDMVKPTVLKGLMIRQGDAKSPYVPKPKDSKGLVLKNIKPPYKLVPIPQGAVKSPYLSQLQEVLTAYVANQAPQDGTERKSG